jgi:SAM-dependent methyltransferase
VINVGAGTGNYEPRDATVLAVEPSETVLAQRPSDAAPAVRGVAEALPVPDDSFDVALAILTVHHWRDPGAGLRELTRVAARQAVVTWDPSVSAEFWLLRDYLPELRALEASLPSLSAVCDSLEVTDVVTLEAPRGCRDGFAGAAWDEPASYLDPAVRAGMSGIQLLDQLVVAEALGHLARDLDDGTWHERNAELATIESLDVGYRLVLAGR